MIEIRNYLIKELLPRVMNLSFDATLNSFQLCYRHFRLYKKEFESILLSKTHI